MDDDLSELGRDGERIEPPLVDRPPLANPQEPVTEIETLLERVDDAFVVSLVRELVDPSLDYADHPLEQVGWDHSSVDDVAVTPIRAGIEHHLEQNLLLRAARNKLRG